MNDTELFAFMDVFNSLRRVFPKRLDEHDAQEMGADYFKTMRRFGLAEVRIGADLWMTRGKFFPKPAEWIALIPRPRVRPELQALSPRETAEYLEAERLHYDGEPCKCEACRAAGVDHRFLRFVPRFDADDREMRGLIGEREVVRGEWIHGEDLRRWYAAKEKFWAEFGSAVREKSMGLKRAKMPFKQRIEEIFKKRPREPKDPFWNEQESGGR